MVLISTGGERMSIKFPDFQVLVTRTDQVPRLQREGDPTAAAGRLAPQVQQDFVRRQQRIERTPSDVKVRMQREEHKQHQEQQDQHQNPRRRKRRGIDIRA